MCNFSFTMNWQVIHFYSPTLAYQWSYLQEGECYCKILYDFPLLQGSIAVLVQVIKCLCSNFIDNWNIFLCLLSLSLFIMMKPEATRESVPLQTTQSYFLVTSEVHIASSNQREAWLLRLGLLCMVQILYMQLIIYSQILYNLSINLSSAVKLDKQLELVETGK